MIGSLIPDLDLPESKLGEKIKPLSFIINLIFGHRHLFHSMLFAAILSIGAYFFSGTYYALALFLGFMSHVILDMLTPQGIEILYPFSRHKVQGFIRTGSFLEHVLIFAILALLAIFVIMHM
jgi:inner membrane protein